ncbi:prephenate dehydratase domain-containing protein [Buchnera aphidicola]|uniref:prephenate dehydratase domain-containing protein n=1 Tax=Buchnera aphidicola TaxID=9 RepID=UPI0032F0805B
MKNVLKKKSQYAILPIKNNFSGKISETNSLLNNKKLFIEDKIKISIKHCLISYKNTFPENIKLLYSHSQPIKQCISFIKKFPKWKIKYTKSSSEAIKKISILKKKGFAAIGNKKCSKIYNLNVIKKNISDKKNNSTIFYIVSKKKK